MDFDRLLIHRLRELSREHIRDICKEVEESDDHYFDDETFALRLARQGGAIMLEGNKVLVKTYEEVRLLRRTLKLKRLNKMLNAMKDMGEEDCESAVLELARLVASKGMERFKVSAVQHLKDILLQRSDKKVLESVRQQQGARRAAYESHKAGQGEATDFTQVQIMKSGVPGEVLLMTQEEFKVVFVEERSQEMKLTGQEDRLFNLFLKNAGVGQDVLEAAKADMDAKMKELDEEEADLASLQGESDLRMENFRGNLSLLEAIDDAQRQKVGDSVDRFRIYDVTDAMKSGVGEMAALEEMAALKQAKEDEEMPEYLRDFLKKMALAGSVNPPPMPPHDTDSSDDDTDEEERFFMSAAAAFPPEKGSGEELELWRGHQGGSPGGSSGGASQGEEGEEEGGRRGRSAARDHEEEGLGSLEELD